MKFPSIEVLRRPKFNFRVELLNYYDTVSGKFTRKLFGVFIQIGWRAVLIDWGN